MLVRKCDVCGEIYEIHGPEHCAIDFFKPDEVKDDHFDYNGSRFRKDLCPKCTRKIKTKIFCEPELPDPLINKNPQTLADIYPTLDSK